MTTLASLPSPADLVELRHMRLALGAVLLLAVSGGLLGVWVLLRRAAFFTHAAGTTTFPGLVAADGTGFSPTIAALAVALGFAFGVERAGAGVERAGARARDFGNAPTALVLVVALALGVILASDVFESGSSVDRLLFGSVLALDAGELWLAAAAAAVALAATLLLGRAWALVGFDAAGAEVSGMPVRRADLLLLLIVAVAVVAALPAVGALLVTSLFVVPAAVAQLAQTRIPAMLATSVGVAALQGVTGLYLSLWLDVPPGPAIAVTGAALFALAVALAVAVALARSRPSALPPAGAAA